MSGKAMTRISMYFHRQMLAMIDECIRKQPPQQVPWADWEEAQSRSEWIREACRQRILAEAKPMAEEGREEPADNAGSWEEYQHIKRQWANRVDMNK